MKVVFIFLTTVNQSYPRGASITPKMIIVLDIDFHDLVYIWNWNSNDSTWCEYFMPASQIFGTSSCEKCSTNWHAYINETAPFLKSDNLVISEMTSVVVVLRKSTFINPFKRISPQPRCSRMFFVGNSVAKAERAWKAPNPIVFLISWMAGRGVTVLKIFLTLFFTVYVQTW